MTPQNTHTPLTASNTALVCVHQDSYILQDELPVGDAAGVLHVPLL